MKISREEFLGELLLRESIQRSLKKRKVEQKPILQFESLIRKYVQQILKEESSAKNSTGINVLEDLLKEIVPVLEVDYKQLTTDQAQRESYRAHIINAVQNSLAPTKATMEQEPEEEPAKKLEEADVNVSVGDNPVAPEDPGSPETLVDPEEAFIDVDKEEGKESEKERKVKDFTISGEDVTGRNFALKTFEKIEKQIHEAFSLLSNDEDRELFYDYLVTNLKLYFDKFEDELSATVIEPTTPEYEKEVTAKV